MIDQNDSNTSVHPYRHPPHVTIGGWLIVLCLTVIFVTIIRTCFLQSFRIPSGSMLPTLVVGDHIFVDKFTYGIRPRWFSRPFLQRRPPIRGDIVVFSHPDRDPSGAIVEMPFIKRIIGMPGDVIRIDGMATYVNGELQNEYQHTIQSSGNPYSDPPARSLGPLELKADEYFVMGDNRVNSEDSRFFGPIHFRDIEGRAFLIYWSWDVGKSYWAVRWDRVGKYLK